MTATLFRVQNVATGGPVNGTDVATLSLIQVIWEPDTLILLQIGWAKTGAAAPTISSITDNHGLVWTKAANVDYDATNPTRNYVYWARAINRGTVTITVNWSAAPSNSSVHAFAVMGANVDDPFDANANALKTESHLTSALSSVSGFSTTNADTIICSFYASRTVAATPGTPSGFTNQYSVSGIRLHADTLLVTSAQSSISIAYPGLTATGSMIAFAVKAATVTGIGIRWIQGWDQYDHAGAVNDVTGGALSSANRGEITFLATSLGAKSLVTGADGQGQALQVGGVIGINGAAYSSTSQGFWVTGTTTTQDFYGQGGSNIADGERVFLHMNMRLAAVLGSTPSGYHYVMSFATNATGRATLCYNIDTNQFKWTAGTLISSTTLASGTPSFNVKNKWTWYEIVLYRHASQGKLQLWAAKFDNKDKFKNMELVLDYTGDTSVATLGVINAFALLGSSVTTNNTAANQFDDIVFSTKGRIGVPCFIKTRQPSITKSSNGGFTASTGSDLDAMVDDVLLDTSDYIKATTGNPTVVYGGMTLIDKYTAVFAVQNFTQAISITSSGYDWAVTCKTDAVEAPGFFGNIYTSTYTQAIACMSTSPQAASNIKGHVAGDGTFWTGNIHNPKWPTLDVQETTYLTRAPNLGVLIPPTRANGGANSVVAGAEFRCPQASQSVLVGRIVGEFVNSISEDNPVSTDPWTVMFTTQSY